MTCPRFASEEHRRKLKGAVVLARRPGENALVGLIENSLFMDWSPIRARFWWTDIFTDDVFGLTWDIDGAKNANTQSKVYQTRHPDWEITVWDAHDDKLPVVIDWEGWLHAPDKFNDRNPIFAMKE